MRFRALTPVPWDVTLSERARKEACADPAVIVLPRAWVDLTPEGNVVGLAAAEAASVCSAVAAYWG
jgi:hypothetical protein